LFIREYTSIFARLFADWAQKEQSSGHAPDLALIIEHKSTLLPRKLILTEFDNAKSSNTSRPCSSDKLNAIFLSTLISDFSILSSAGGIYLLFTVVKPLSILLLKTIRDN
ncbi:MAG: hypothetical protein AABZ36_07300, partial [Nitrospirota bacterium]